MVDKILGGTDPANNILFTMTEGIGKPLRPVDASTNGGNITVVQTLVMQASSFVTQQPGALDDPLQLTFGGAQATPEFDLNASGALTTLVTDEYQFRFLLNFGRQGQGTAAVMFARLLINGVAAGNSVWCRLDTDNIVIPATFQTVVAVTAGDVITAEIIRDSAGTSAGGVFTASPTLVGWADAASCQITIVRTEAVSA